MDSTKDEVPAKRRRIEDREKTQLPQETLLQVLLWLDRFDIDGKQITARRLRSLVENNQMPLRTVDRVDYHHCPYWERNTLSIHLAEDDKNANVELVLETDADAQKAASYLSTCFVSNFRVSNFDALPENAIIAAPARMRELFFGNCNFDNDVEDTLSNALKGSSFQCLKFINSRIPDWQINDKRLESLRLRGCNEIQVRTLSRELNDAAEEFEVTEAGMLSYCFMLDDHLPMPARRSLQLPGTIVATPAFFEKLVEASKNSQLTCDVELSLERLRFDVGNLDVGVLPSRSSQFDPMTGVTFLHNVRYNIPEHGNGSRLLMLFKSEDDAEWDVVVRHGKKEHEEFFEPTPDEEDG